MKFMHLTGGAVSVALLLAMCGAGCQSRATPTMLSESDEASNTAGLGRDTEQTQELPDVDLASLDFGLDENLRRIHFDYDSYALRPDAIAVLSGNAAVIKTMPDGMIQVEGHCDERGTQEYNLALGERRALAARAHLMRLGIPGDRIITISYGEEFPIDPGHHEGAWSENRRCMFNAAR